MSLLSINLVEVGNNCSVEVCVFSFPIFRWTRYANGLMSLFFPFHMIVIGYSQRERDRMRFLKRIYELFSKKEKAEKKEPEFVVDEKGRKKMRVQYSDLTLRQRRQLEKLKQIRERNAAIRKLNNESQS